MDHVCSSGHQGLPVCSGGSCLILFFGKAAVMKPALMAGWLTVVEAEQTALSFAV